MYNEQKPIWTLGIQTCPRTPVYLNNTIEAIQRGGWDQFTVFGEPGSVVNAPLALRPKNYGDWSNWICALFELYVTHPQTTYFLMFEDDITCCTNLRVYLEWVIPQLGDFGCLSLYTPQKHHQQFHGWHDESDSNWMMVGAQAILFKRKSLERFLCDPKVVNYSQIKNFSKDSLIGQWAYKNEVVLYHTPSLVDHIGENSTIEMPIHKAVDYIGDQFDITEWINQPVKITPAKSKLLF